MTPAKRKAAHPYHHGDLRRTLIDAAVAIVSEEQNWGFSLREVARRAGVSHNAPYNHFAEKRDLLDAVAAEGFDALRSDMIAAMTKAGGAEVALLDIARAYVAFATGNPALYRLMFGPELAHTDDFTPALSKAAGTQARKVLHDVISLGCDEKRFVLSQTDGALMAAVVSGWSIVHGLAMLLIDKKIEGSTQPEKVAEAVMSRLLHGLLAR
jgi:AcrR family transcriptional regulator